LAQKLKIVQWILIGLGVVMVGIFLVARIDREVGSQAEIEKFEQARRDAAASVPTPTQPIPPTPKPLPEDFPLDTALWAQGRIEKYEESLEHDFDAPMAILRIPKINLEVAVLEGTDELTLNRAVGRVEGTATVDTMGNLGIAGHRDGFFRGLKDVVVGDVMEFETLDGNATFVIDDISIVTPSDVYVLAPTEVPTITLVTCYPFYYVGKAPKRYIVRARIQGS
jgi:sortase A